mgnify:CR=1 FL=1
MSQAVPRTAKTGNLASEVERLPVVACNVAVSYIYAIPDTWEKYIKACEELGWNKKTLLTQLLHSYGSVHLSYYQKAAEIDALARGFKGHQGEHYSLLRDWGELPRYTETQPAFERSPLVDIHEVSANAEYRRRIGSVNCSGRNSAILNLTTIVERSNLPQTLSRIMLWHFDHYWNRGYVLQLRSDEQETLTPEL